MLDGREPSQHDVSGLVKEETVEKTEEEAPAKNPVKVVGKIDLDALKPKAKPEKTEKQPKAEKKKAAKAKAAAKN